MRPRSIQLPVTLTCFRTLRSNPQLISVEIDAVPIRKPQWSRRFPRKLGVSNRLADHCDLFLDLGQSQFMFGFRKPSLRKRAAARTSVKRLIRHSFGLKAPRGWGWLTNPRKAAYNRVYSRATRGCLVLWLAATLAITTPIVLTIRWFTV
jgi:hypothetical protein